MNGNTYHSVSHALPHLAHQLLTAGEEVGSRGGSRVLEILHAGVTLEFPLEREVLTPGRKASLVAQIAESAWVLAGRNDVEWLSHYLKRAPEFSDDGKTWRGGYGPRLRAWNGVESLRPTDQLAEVIRLLKEEPTTRRAVMSIFDPDVDYVETKDVPCNNWIAFSSRLGRLDLHVATRSNDLVWGWSGINAFEWSVLQEIVAYTLGVEVGKLVFSINSLHSYDRHWKRLEGFAAHRDQPVFGLDPSPRFDYPVMRNSADPVKHLDLLLDGWFKLEERIREGVATVEEIAVFPEPMLRSWLWVLRWWWLDREEGALAAVDGTALAYAARLTPVAEVAQKTTPRDDEDAFLAFVGRLHAEKDAAYGDSWKRRGETLGILANVARKVDRLGTTDDHETAADTAIDLLVYLTKYRLWLVDEDAAPAPAFEIDDLMDALSDHEKYVRRYLEGDLRARAAHFYEVPDAETIAELRDAFNNLFECVQRINVVHALEDDMLRRVAIVETMTLHAYKYALRLWLQEEGS